LLEEVKVMFWTFRLASTPTATIELLPKVAVSVLVVPVVAPGALAGVQFASTAQVPFDGVASHVALAPFTSATAYSEAQARIGNWESGAKIEWDLDFIYWLF
jgi:hypothetical protein